jgi:hypothetical protein
LAKSAGAIGSYAAEVASYYENRYREPLEYQVRFCYPHGPSWLRAYVTVCVLETPHASSLVAATSWRNWPPRGFTFGGAYGPVDVYTGTIKGY